MKNNFVNLKTIHGTFRFIIDVLKNNSNIIMLLSLFTTGLVIGTANILNSENYRIISGAIFEETDNFFKIIINGVFANYLILTVNFVMGLCLVGEPFIFISSVFEGMYISGKYATHIFFNGYENIIRFAFCELLFHIILYTVIMCSQLFSMQMSRNLKQFCCGNINSLSLKKYLLKYFCLIIASSGIVLLKALTGVVL